MFFHEYSISGHSRTTVGRWLFWGSLILAGVATWMITGLVELAQIIGLGTAWADKTASLLTAGAIFPLGYLTINNWVWKMSWVKLLFGLPNIGGEWDCKGVTLDENGGIKYEWIATILISQTWEKIHVHLKTAQSESNSITAAVIKLPTGNFKLIYTYRNEPRIGEPALHQHSGCCELEFDSMESAAEGEYFNNRGRITHGRMTLKRKT